MKAKNNQVQRIEAAGGVLYRQVNGDLDIVLIFRNGVWDLPKGKKEQEESFEECALREVSEEVGIEQLRITGYLSDTYHEYNENGIRFGKKTKWYSMTAENPDSELKPQLEEGITKVSWRRMETAKSEVEYQNLKKVIEVFKYKKKRGSI